MGSFAVARSMEENGKEEETYESARKVDACGSSVRAVQPLRFLEAKKAMVGGGHIEWDCAKCWERKSYIKFMTILRLVSC